jgi:sulfonate dioxygenase
MSTFHGLYHDEKQTITMATPSLTEAVLKYTPPDPPLEEVTPAKDRALFADPTKASLFAQASAIEELTPHIGTELKGVQLSKLTAAQKDELALLVAEVGVYRTTFLALC